MAPQQVERYDGLRAKAVVVNSGGSCVVTIRPVWSEYLGVLLVAVMYCFTVRLAMVAVDGFGKWGFIAWSVLLFVTAFCGFAFWAQLGRVTVIEISASREGIVVRRRLFGVVGTFQIKSGALENVLWHATKDLTGSTWHSFLQVALPSGKEVTLMDELEVMDERFGERVMGLLAEVTGWKSKVKRIHMEPPDPSSSS